MKIALLVPGFSRDRDDWAIPALQTFACRLAQQHELHVFSLRYPEAGQYSLCGFTHHATGGGTRAGLYSFLVVGQTVRALLAEHRRAPFDLFHAFWVDEPALAGVLAGAVLQRPVLASIGGGELVHLPEIAYGTWRSRWRRQLMRLALARSTLVTAGSPLACRLAIERGVPPAKMSLAPLGVDTDHFCPGPARHGQQPVLVQAASMTPVKNQMLLLAVAARVCAHYPELRVRVAGVGPLAGALRAEAERLGLGEAIVWAGAVPHREMPAFYRQGDLYLQTSRYESQGMAVLEALACGLPVLGTPAGLLPQVSAFSPTANPEHLSEQVLTLLAGRGEVARSLLPDEYSIESASARFLSLYRSCLSS